MARQGIESKLLETSDNDKINDEQPAIIRATHYDEQFHIMGLEI